MKLGPQGHSVFFASGDSGVAGSGDSCLGPNAIIFSPNFRYRGRTLLPILDSFMVFLETMFQFSVNNLH
jgi:hypothetical protein